MPLSAAIILIPIFCLLAIVLIPARVVNSNPKIMRRLVTGLVGIEFAFSVAIATFYLAFQNMAYLAQSLDWIPAAGAIFNIYYDGATSLMLILVSFVSLVVSRYSIRYLDGEATQGRYFRWLSFTIGAVSLMIVAGNLVLFFFAWVTTSFGLHQLLLHYHHREAARHAAWTKFTISRLGDVFLVSALVLIFKTYDTVEFSELFEKAKLLLGSSQVTVNHIAIGWLLVLGAITKSAQFPFHTWLPDTMETPTPISALMHAGIVNAGGYLIIRMSPVVGLAPSALIMLAAIGAFTACLGGVVMMTQSSIKRALAYSTIAQMGFMMLQCGLGIFSAAMLHILAHSLYKAHAFLSSGSVVDQSSGMAGAKSTSPSVLMSFTYLLGAASFTSLIYFLISTSLSFEDSANPGSGVLAFILCLALTTWGWRILTLGELKTMFLGIAGLIGLCSAYLGSYFVIENLMEPTAVSFSLSPAMNILMVGVVVAFLAIFTLQALISQKRLPKCLESLYIHAVNGFYVDVIYRRIFATIPK